MARRRTIEQLGTEVCAKLESLGFTPCTIKKYRNTFNRFARYAESRGERFWSETITVDFIRDVYGFDLAKGDRPNQNATQRLRACRMLGFFEASGELPGRMRKDGKNVPPSTRKYLELMVADDMSRGMTEATMRGRHADVCDLLAYLDRESVAFPGELTPKVLESFLEERHRLAPGAMPRVLSSTRCFLRCMFSYGVIDINLAPLVPHASRYPRKPVSKIWSSQEVEALLKSIPRTDAAGRRDFAIVSLLVVYGMRSGDVCRLRMSDIDWDASAIRLVQHKNNVGNTLPLTDQVGWALADWLSNGRPKQAGCPEVFTRLTAPYCALEDVSPILARRMSDAGIAKEKGVKSGAHSLRHSVASGMLANGAEVPVIASVLGDTVGTASKVYLHADIEGLRRCALAGEV